MLAPFLAALKLELDRGLAAPARLWLSTTLQQAARAALRAALVGLALLVGSGFLLAAAQMGLARRSAPRWPPPRLVLHCCALRSWV